MTTPSEHRYEIFLLAVIAGFAAMFAFTVQAVWSPFLFLIALVLLSLPLRRHHAVHAVLAVAGLMVARWFVTALSAVLAPVLVAFLLAYILDPLIDRLARRKIPRLAAALGVLLLFLGAGAATLFLVVPAVIDSFRGVNPQKIGDDITRWIDATGIPLLRSYGLQEEDVRKFVDTNLLPHVQALIGSVVGSLSNFAASLLGLLGQLANAVIIPILTFYLLLDWDKIKAWVLRLFPPARREPARLLYRKIDAILAAYLRGAITVALVNMIVVSTLFTLIGVPFSIVLGIFSGLFTLIPQFGVFITMILATLVCLFGPSPGLHIVLALAVLLGENLLESSVLYPKIVGNALGLHPAALIVSLLIFAYFLGFLGMLIAVPATAILARILEEWLERRERLKDEA